MVEETFVIKTHPLTVGGSLVSTSSLGVVYQEKTTFFCADKYLGMPMWSTSTWTSGSSNHTNDSAVELTGRYFSDLIPEPWEDSELMGYPSIPARLSGTRYTR